MTAQEYEAKIIALKEANEILGNALKSRDKEIEELKEKLERRHRNGAEQKNAEN